MVALNQVKEDGQYTIPRSYGVYVLSEGSHQQRKYRFGNHPVRQQELISEFGSCQLYQNVVFMHREHAKQLADILNREK